MISHNDDSGCDSVRVDLYRDPALATRHAQDLGDELMRNNTDIDTGEDGVSFSCGMDDGFKTMNWDQHGYEKREHIALDALLVNTSYKRAK